MRPVHPNRCTRAEGERRSTFLSTHHATAIHAVHRASIVPPGLTVLIVALPGLLGDRPVLAQCVEGCSAIHTLFGEVPGDSFGWKSNFLGDVNGDGINDFIITARDNDAGGNNAGRAYVYSGADGVELFRVTGSIPNGRLGNDANRAGDVSGDGVRDAIIGAPSAGAGRAIVASGVDGTPIHTFSGEQAGDQFGFRVAGDADINGDGTPDLLISAIGHDAGGTDSGRAYVYSGVDFSLICAVDGLGGGDQLGTSLSDVGDINNDNRADFVVGARNANGGSGQAYVYSYDGVSCNLVFTLNPQAPASDFGHLFADGGRDINNDGTPDIYVGDWPGTRAYIYSGVDGSLIHQLVGDNNGQFGLGEMIDDVNGDGHADMVLAAWVSNAGGGGAGKGFIYSGRDGSILETFTHDVPGANFGFDAKGLGDVDLDGRPDYLFTAASDLAGRGVAYVIAGTIAPIASRTGLFVTGFGSGNVVEFNAQTGDGVGALVPGGAGGLASAHSIILGPEGRLYVTSAGTNQVLRYRIEDGSFVDVFASGAGSPLSAPTDARFGPDGNLYVVSFNSGQVLRFDGLTGSFIDVFATAPVPGQAEMIQWGADGHLYLTTGQGHSVLRFDGATGAPLPGPLGAAGTAEFVPSGSGGILDCHHLLFGPDGNLYVSSMDNARIIRFDGNTGALIGTFVNATGGVSLPHGIAFGPDSHLYVASFGTNNVLRYDGTTGAFLDVFATGSGLTQPTALVFTFHPADFDIDGDVGPDDAALFAACLAGSGVPIETVCEPADFDSDGDVDCGDTANFRRGWTGPPEFPPLFGTCDQDCNTNGVADVIDIEVGAAGDCNQNRIPDSCDIASGTSPDEDGDGEPDECCTSIAPSQPTGVVPTNRYIAFTVDQVGAVQAIRVTLVAIPPPNSAATGRTMWVGPPEQISENAGKRLASELPGSPAFPLSTLQCTPFFADWGAMGTVHVYGLGIVPGGQYELQALAEGCGSATDETLSQALPVAMSGWGDVVKDCTTNPCGAPDGIVNVAFDVVAILDKFQNRPQAPIKSRCDIEPALPNQLIGITDVTRALDAFSGIVFPFPSIPAPCP